MEPSSGTCSERILFVLKDNKVCMHHSCVSAFCLGMSEISEAVAGHFVGLYLSCLCFLHWNTPDLTHLSLSCAESHVLEQGRTQNLCSRMISYGFRISVNMSFHTQTSLQIVIVRVPDLVLKCNRSSWRKKGLQFQWWVILLF